VAVGFDDSNRIEVLSGEDLSSLYTPDSTGVVEKGVLGAVSWSVDGRWLYAGGKHNQQAMFLIRRWAEGGRGAFQDLPAGQNTILHLLPLAGGGVIFGAGDPAWGVLDASGQPQHYQGPTTADVRGLLEGFRLASDSTNVQFGYEYRGKVPARF